MSCTKRTAQISTTILLWLFIVMSAIISGFLIYGMLDFYWYKFPKINSLGGLFVGIGSYVIPALLTGASVFALIKDNKKLAVICLIVFVPVTVNGFCVGLGSALFKPPISSYTSDPSDFGVYDLRPADRLRLNPPRFYPSSIPNDAENVKYCYYYQNDSAETLYCAIAWQTDEKELRKVEMQMAQDKIVWKGEKQCAIRLTGRFPMNAVYIDFENNQICYVVTSREELLPERIEMAFILSFCE